MDERDLETEEAAMWLLVDHVHVLIGEVGELAPEVIDLIGNVMNSWAAVGEELPDRRLLAERRQELDAALSHPNRGGFDTLRLDHVTPLDLGPEQPTVRVDRFVEVLDRDAEMMDPLRPHPKGS
jgi:hypothetical protein